MTILILPVLLVIASLFGGGPQPSGVGVGGRIDRDLLQPATYVSPSGEFELHVDPTDPQGSGRGNYRLTRSGREVWSGERPFTFWEAVVDDAGVSGGYAYSSGYMGRGPDCGDFHVAIFDIDGGVLLDEVTHRSPHRYASDSPPDPCAAWMVHHPELDRMVIRLRSVHERLEERPKEMWCPYRFAGAEALAKVTMEERGTMWSVAARPVIGTPLTLVEWRKSLGGEHFELRDSDLATVCTLEPPLYRVADYSPQDSEIRRHGTILRSDQPGSFEIWHVAEAARVRYRVEHDSVLPAAWSIREASREPYELPAEPEVLAIQLEELPRISFGMRTNANLEQAPGIFTRIDRFGRILVEDRESYAVHVFGADGKRISTCALGPGEDWGAGLAATSDGGIFLELGSSGREYARFDSDGTRTDTVTLGDRASFGSGAEDAWCVRDYSLARIENPSGKLLQRIPRRPDGRWFHWIASPVVGPDGTLVVLEMLMGFPSLSDWGCALSFFSAEGAPLRTLVFPRALYGACRVAHGGRWIAMGVARNDLFLFRLADEALFHFQFPEIDEEKLDKPFGFSPEGDELWVVHSEPLELRRYRMP